MIHNRTFSFSMIPNLVSETSQYSLRNSNNIRNLRCRTRLCSSSFLPSVITMLNNLPDFVRNAESELVFKNYLYRDKTEIPIYYYTGDRNQVLHTILSFYLI